VLAALISIKRNGNGKYGEEMEVGEKPYATGL
jgi:hypothetical protein